ISKPTHQQTALSCSCTSTEAGKLYGSQAMRDKKVKESARFTVQTDHMVPTALHHCTQNIPRYIHRGTKHNDDYKYCCTYRSSWLHISDRDKVLVTTSSC
ncbi:unnamed protein product, partial [Sphacelaria rigidula]